MSSVIKNKKNLKSRVTDSQSGAKAPARGAVVVSEDVAISVPESVVSKSLMTDLRRLISSARQRVAVLLNVESVLLNWHVGRLIRIDIMENKRDEYGAHIEKRVAEKRTAEYGPGWGLRKIQYCVCSADFLF